MAANKSERVTFSPSEFAALFGKSTTWAYRRLYAGQVQSISEFGRIMIPASEVEKILGTAVRYEGQKKTTKPRTKEQIVAMKPKLKSAWQAFLEKKRAGQPMESQPTDSPRGVAASARGERQAMMIRLARRGK